MNQKPKGAYALLILAMLSNTIKKMRLQRNMSQEKFGNLIGNHAPYISRIERGENISVETLANLAEKLGLKLEIKFIDPNETISHDAPTVTNKPPKISFLTS